MALGLPSSSMGPWSRLAERLLLGPLLVLLVSGLGMALGQRVYTNTWAVHIAGGPDEADRIASKHGFVNHGNVSCWGFFTLFCLSLWFFCLSE